VTTRPTIAPAAAAALLAAVPSRLVKKLDADPEQAAAWTWSEDGTAVTATTPSGERVRLVATGGGVARAEDVTCTCLLAPRCLHVAAVVSLLRPDDAAPAAASSASASAAAAAAVPTPAAESVALTPDHADAIALAWRAAAALVTTGADATGTSAQATLLRAIHACRAAGLHRAGSAATRVLAQIRELRADRPEFALAQLTADLRELLGVLRALAAAGAAAPSALVGTARRRYETIGGLRLYGVLSDAVAARSGYGGVVTYLTDGSGRMFTVSDVAPGDAARAAASYHAAADIGDATLSHRELGRAGLFLGAATASRDGRLGAGKDVRAVRAGASVWSEPAIASLWKPSLADQLARLAAASAEPIERRPAGYDLVFVTGELVVGGGAVGVVLADGRALALVPASDTAELRYRDNLIVLAAHRGKRVHLVGRVRLDRPRVVAPLAVGAVDATDSLVLPDALGGRVNLGFDRLGTAGATGGKLETPPPAASLDPLLALRRRVERVGLAGAATLPPEAGGELHREAAAFTSRMLGGAATALRDLAAAAHQGDRRADGRRVPVDAERFALAWLRAAAYVDAAERRIAQASWLA
jgi:hypothetical protein